MKRFLLFLSLMSACALAYAQEDPFSVRDGSVVWQAVYQSQLDSADVVNSLLAKGVVSDLVSIPGGVSCRVRRHPVGWKAAGFDRMSVPLYLVSNQMEAHAVVLFKDGRYRVTVDQIMFIAPATDGLQERGESAPLEDYAVSARDDFKKVFYSMKAAAVLDADLYRLFEIQAAKEEEW